MTWKIAGTMLAMVVVWSGIFLWALKWMLDRYHGQIAKRIGELESTSATVERDILRLRAELPKEYVQREDWIRFGSVIDAKLDALREAVGRLTEKVYAQRPGRTREGQT